MSRLLAVALAAAVLPATWVAAAAAAPRTVDVSVTDAGFHDNDLDGNGAPTITRIVAGDTVRWVWHPDNASPHTVTSLGDGGVAFDSDRPCEDAGQDVAACRAHPYTFSLRFEQPGTYRYHSETDVAPPLLGTIEVVAPPEEPSPSPSPEPSAGGEPTPSEGGSPSEGSEPPAGGGGSGGADPGGEASPTPSDGSTGGGGGSGGAASPTESHAGSSTSRASSSGTYRARVLRGFGVVDAPPPSSPAPVAPEVAPRSPAVTFSPFPSPSPPPQDVRSEFAVDIPAPARRGPSRGLLTGIAATSVLATAGAFGKFVLFGRPWG